MKLLFVLLLALAGSAVGAANPNMLSDPGFEAFPSGFHASEKEAVTGGWRVFSLPGAGGSFQTVRPGHSGKYGLFLKRTSEKADAAVDRQEDLLKVQPAQRLRACVWARSDKSSRLILTLAAYNDQKQWLKQQGMRSWKTGPDWKLYCMDYRAPEQAAFVNYALRIGGANGGEAVVDDCSLVDVTSEAPLVPQMTYPVSETVDSFQPQIGFAGPGHTAWQCVIKRGDAVLWDSGERSGPDFSLRCEQTLPPASRLLATVRLKSPGGWGAWSRPSAFSTPQAPLVRLISPREAWNVRGPSVTVRWQMETPGMEARQTLSLDGGPPMTLDANQRSMELHNLSEGTHTVRISVAAGKRTALSDARFHVRAAPSAKGELFYYDLSPVVALNMKDPAARAQQYDACHAVAALQGLVNRKGPRLFVKLLPEDDAWLRRLREKDEWLAEKRVRTLTPGLEGLRELFKTFAGDFRGAVVWDPGVPATANVATTAAGAEDLIPLRIDTSKGSVYSRIGDLIPTRLDLRGKFTGRGTIPDTGLPSTGSAKCDSYVWARERYLASGRCNPGLLMYSIDAWWLKCDANLGHQLTNRDYIVQNKGFAFDLNVWDEAPVDDPGQKAGTDLQTLKSILLASAKRCPGMVHLVGFVPWPFKYTNWQSAGGSHEPVPTEWKSAEILSAYNVYMDADTYGMADVANASVYSLYPMPQRLTQNPKLSPLEMRKLGYLTPSHAVAPLNFLNIYLGDYDSGSWLVSKSPARWDDPYRGKLPLSWAFNPNHAGRMAAVYEYLRRMSTDADSYIAGDSGSGYINPSLLFGTRPSGLPDASERWVQHNLRWYRLTNTKATGFVLNGNAGPVTEAVDRMYARFSGDGAFSQKLWYPQGDHMQGSMPCLLQQRDLTGNAAKDVDIVQADGILGGPQFLNYRTILVTPTYVHDLYKGVREKDPMVPWALVDARTYAALASASMGKEPDERATYTFDTIPDSLEAGKAFTALFGARNDGWKAWAPGEVALQVEFLDGSSRRERPLTIALPKRVAPSDGLVVEARLNAPERPGRYTVRYQMVKDGVAFSSNGDYAWEKEVTVTRQGARPSPV